MTHRRPQILKPVALSIFCLVFAGAQTADAVLSLDQLGMTYTIDFDSTVTGINNGTLNSGGAADFLINPTAGHLDADGWALNMNGSSLPTSQVNNQEKPFGSEETGNDNLMRDTTDIDGSGSDGLNPTTFHGDGLGVLMDFGGSQFTPGSIFLKAVNNTGQAISDTQMVFDLWSAGVGGNEFALALRYSTDDGTSFSSPVSIASGYTANGSLQQLTVNPLTVAGPVADGDSIIFAFDWDEADWG